MISRIIRLHSFSTAFGPIQCACTEHGLAAMSLVNDAPHRFTHLVQRLYPNADFEPGGQLCDRVEQQVAEYTANKRKRFALPLVWHGTDFQQRVLQAVSGIPYGEVRTYGEVAMMVGHPRAARAVGTAMAGNVLPLVVPCHRVVAAGGIGGYGRTRAGIEVKKKLLGHEGFDVTSLRPSKTA